MRRNVQDGANLVATFAERDPTETLEFSRRQGWSTFAKYIVNDAAMKPIGNLYQRGLIGC
jgi:hypothetical protein